MNKKQQESILTYFHIKMKEVLMAKGDDYADADRLSNFKKAGDICGLSAEQNCLSLIATKVARLGVLLNSKEAPKNESIKDSIIDLANYGALLYMIIAEKRSTSPIDTTNYA